MRPGRLVIPDQIVDYTWGRAHTVDTGEVGTLLHVDFSDPYDHELREDLPEGSKPCQGHRAYQKENGRARRITHQRYGKLQNGGIQVPPFFVAYLVVASVFIRVAGK